MGVNPKTRFCEGGREYRLLTSRARIFSRARAVDFFCFLRQSLPWVVRLRECPLGELPVYDYLWGRNNITFLAKLSNFTNFCFKCLLQLFHHLRNFIRHLKKHLLISQLKNPYVAGVWISHETLLLSVWSNCFVPGRVKPFTPTYSYHIWHSVSRN